MSSRRDLKAAMLSANSPICIMHTHKNTLPYSSINLATSQAAAQLLRTAWTEINQSKKSSSSLVSTYLWLVRLLCQLSVVLLDEHIPNVHQASVPQVTENIDVQDPVHKGINLHEQRAAAGQRGKSLAGAAAPPLPAHQRSGRGTHPADPELQSLEQKHRKQRLPD